MNKLKIGDIYKEKNNKIFIKIIKVNKKDYYYKYIIVKELGYSLLGCSFVNTIDHWNKSHSKQLIKLNKLGQLLYE